MADDNHIPYQGRVSPDAVRAAIAAKQGASATTAAPPPSSPEEGAGLQSEEPGTTSPPPAEPLPVEPAPVATPAAYRANTASGITTRKVNWLWRGRVPLRKVTVVDGHPGVSKSTVWNADIAARITRGWPMPDGSHEFTEPRNVAIFSTEDDADDTLVPRFIAHGGDLTRLHFPTIPTEDGGERKFSFPDDIAAMQAFISDLDVVMSVIDPWVAHIRKATDSHKDQDVRVVMGALHAVAANTNSAILGIRHIIKGEHSNALHAGGGSIGIIGDARAAVMHLRDIEDPDLLYLFAVKENLAIRGATLRYRVESVDVEVSDGTMSVPKIVYDGEDERDAETLFRDIQGARRKPGPAADELTGALEVLDLMLGQGQHVSSTDLEAAAKAHGVTPATLKRARQRRAIATEYVVDPETKKGHWEVYDPAAGFLAPEPEQEAEVIPLHPKTGKPFTAGSPEKETKPCAHCGEEFEPKTSRAKFCTPQCRNAARRKKTDDPPES